LVTRDCAPFLLFLRHQLYAFSDFHGLANQLSKAWLAAFRIDGELAATK
jgi:hypothetical protein